MSDRRLKHGEFCSGKPSKEADIWNSMHMRCRNPNDQSYPNYGGRGITVCERWSGENGLSSFIADMGRKPEGRSIDRIDNDGPYSPENCRWATRQEQMRNMRRNRKITVNGVTKCMTEWAEVNGIPYGTVYRRIHEHGWDDVRAVTEPVTGKGCRSRVKLTINGESKTIKEWSIVSGIPECSIRDRLRYKWTPEAAVFQPLQRKG